MFSFCRRTGEGLNLSALIRRFARRLFGAAAVMNDARRSGQRTAHSRQHLPQRVIPIDPVMHDRVGSMQRDKRYNAVRKEFVDFLDRMFPKRNGFFHSRFTYCTNPDSVATLS